MRNFTSIFALAGRLTLFRVLSVSLMMALIQVSAFFYEIHNLSEEGVTSGGLFPLYEMFNRSAFSASFAAAFILITVFLLRMASDLGRSSSRYTFFRLSACRKTAISAAGLYALCCYTVLWAVQAAALIGLSKVYQNTATSVFSQTALLLAAGTDGFARFIFSFADPLTHLFNFLMVLGLSAAVGALTRAERKDGLGAMAVFSAGLYIFSLTAGSELTAILCLCCGPSLLMMSIGISMRRQSFCDTDKDFNENALETATSSATDTIQKNTTAKEEELL